MNKKPRLGQYSRVKDVGCYNARPRVRHGGVRTKYQNNYTSIELSKNCAAFHCDEEFHHVHGWFGGVRACESA